MPDEDAIEVMEANFDDGAEDGSVALAARGMEPQHVPESNN